MEVSQGSPPTWDVFGPPRLRNDWDENLVLNETLVTSLPLHGG